MHLRNRVASVVVLVLLCSAFLWYYKKENVIYKEQLSFLKQQVEQNSLYLIKNMQYATWVIEHQEKDVFPLGRLIYRYSDEVCEKCVQEDLDELFKLQNRIGKQHILILPSFFNDRNSEIRLNNELARFNFQNIGVKGDMPIDEMAGTPMRYFIFSSKESAGFVFFPIRGKRELTEQYFQMVEEKIGALK